MYEAVFDGAGFGCFVGNAVKGEHDHDCLVRVLFKRGQDVFPSCIVGVFPFRARRAEDIELPACNGAEGMDGAGALQQKRAGFAFFVLQKLLFDHAAQRLLKLFYSVPVDSHHFQRVEGNVLMRPAARAAAF